MTEPTGEEYKKDGSGLRSVRSSPRQHRAASTPFSATKAANTHLKMDSNAASIANAAASSQKSGIVVVVGSKQLVAGQSQEDLDPYFYIVLTSL